MNKNKTQRSTMRPQATFSFFIFLQLFHFFSLLVAPSSSLLLPPCPPSSSSLFLPRPALSKSLRIHRRPFFIKFDKSVTDQTTNQPTHYGLKGLQNESKLLLTDFFSWFQVYHIACLFSSPDSEQFKSKIGINRYSPC